MNNLFQRDDERAVTMNNGIYLHILAVGSLKTFFFLNKQLSEVISGQ